MGMRSGVLEGRPIKPPKKEPDIPEDELQDLSNRTRRLLSTRERPRYPPSARRYAHSDMNVPPPSGTQRDGKRSMSTPNVSTDSNTFAQYGNAQSLSNTPPGPQAGSSVARPYPGTSYNQDSATNPSTDLRSHVQTTGFPAGEQLRRGGSVDNYRPERWYPSNAPYPNNMPRSNSMQVPSDYGYGLNDPYDGRIPQENSGVYRSIHAFDTSNPISSRDTSSLPLGSAQRHGVETLEPEQISPRGSVETTRSGENRIAQNDIGKIYGTPYAAAPAGYPEHSNSQGRTRYTGSGGQTYYNNRPGGPVGVNYTHVSDASMPYGAVSSSSTYPADNRSTEPDFETARDTVTHTGINLRRSYLANKERSTGENEENPFQESVKVWQHGYLDPSPSLDHIILILDTGCENSNWVAEQIITELGAQKRKLPRPAEFITFNGESMTTSWEATLSFRIMSGVKKYTCNFLVAVNESTPFDMVIGSRDIIANRLLTRGQRNFGLGHKKQDRVAKREEAARIAEQEKNSERHAERVRQLEEQRRRDELARRNEAQNQAQQNDWNNGNNQGGQNDWNNGNNQGGQSSWNSGNNQDGQSGWNTGQNQGGQNDWNNGNNQGGQGHWNSDSYYGGGR